MLNQKKILALVAMLTAPAALVFADGHEQEAPPQNHRAATYERVTEVATPALVRVEYILSVDSMWGGEAEEQEMEVSGVLVSEDGVVLLGNSAMGGWMAMFGDSQISPRDVKVKIGDDTLGVPASVIARDSDRDLCWLKLDEAPDEPLPFIELKVEHDRPGVGSEIYQVSRLDEFFDRVPVVSEAVVSAHLSKPRDLLYIGMGQIEPGLPMFHADGTFAGFAIVQSPAAEGSSMDGGFDGSMYESLILAVLPAEDVASATGDALALLDEEE